MAKNKINTLLANEEFANELKGVTTIECAVALFAREGVTITAGELNEYLDSENGDDLTEEELEGVSGGCAICIGIRIIRGLINAIGRSSSGGGGNSFGGGGGGGGGR